MAHLLALETPRVAGRTKRPPRRQAGAHTQYTGVPGSVRLPWGQRPDGPDQRQAVGLRRWRVPRRWALHPHQRPPAGQGPWQSLVARAPWASCPSSARQGDSGPRENDQAPTEGQRQ